jgi:hypothetical protein
VTRNGTAPTRHRRATIPLPVADNHGVPFPEDDVAWFEETLLGIGSGFRKHLRSQGVWDNGGFIHREPVAVYVTTVPAERMSALKTLLDEACRVFRQEAVLLEITDVEKVLVASTAEEAALAEARVGSSK